MRLLNNAAAEGGARLQGALHLMRCARTWSLYPGTQLGDHTPWLQDAPRHRPQASLEHRRGDRQHAESLAVCATQQQRRRPAAMAGVRMPILQVPQGVMGASRAMAVDVCPPPEERESRPEISRCRRRRCAILAVQGCLAIAICELQITARQCRRGHRNTQPRLLPAL